MKKYIILLTVLLCSRIAAQDSTVVEIFTANSVQFGYVNQDGVTAEDNGRVISKTIELPEFNEPVEIMAYLDITSLGDPWDRAGTIKLTDLYGADIELLKFMTAYNVPTSHVEDVSDLVSLLQGSVTIKAFIDTWQLPGFSINFKLVYKTNGATNNADWAVGAFFNNDVKRVDINNDLTTVDVRIPSGLSKINLAYFASGHCTDGRGADEFVPKYNGILIDDVEVYRYEPWRDDCSDFPSSGTYWLSRSGWCPGDIVHPLVIDVTDYLTPGNHKITYNVEDIREADTDGNYGYWRISSYLSGWLDDNGTSAHHLSIAQPSSKIVALGEDLLMNLSIEDINDNLVVSEDKQVQLTSQNSAVEFSIDNNNYSSQLNIDVKNGTCLFWVRGAAEGAVNIIASDINGTINDSEPVELLFIKNYALGESVIATDACSQNEEAEYAVDGDLRTKWCSNASLPLYLTVGLDELTEINSFRVYHAGSGGEPGYYNTADYSIEYYDHQNNSWVICAELYDNYDNSDGNITYHFLEEPVYSDSIKLNLITPGYGDDVARIYEFQFFNIDRETYNLITSIEKNTFNLPENFVLFQNYPNPFNGGTSINYTVNEYSNVRIIIYNVLGEVVDYLFSGDIPKGYHSVKWNGNNLNGSKVSGGVYFCSIRVSGVSGSKFIKTNKMIYLP